MPARLPACRRATQVGRELGKRRLSDKPASPSRQSPTQAVQSSSVPLHAAFKGSGCCGKGRLKVVKDLERT